MSIVQTALVFSHSDDINISFFQVAGLVFPERLQNGLHVGLRRGLRQTQFVAVICAVVSGTGPGTGAASSLHCRSRQPLRSDVVRLEDVESVRRRAHHHAWYLSASCVFVSAATMRTEGWAIPRKKKEGASGCMCARARVLSNKIM